MINAMQAAELTSGSRDVPKKIQDKFDSAVRQAARTGLDSAEVRLYDIDSNMADRIVDFLTGLGYGVRLNFVRDPRDGSDTRLFRVIWKSKG